MKYDPQKHHRRSIRLKGYDYTQPGAYFVTICSQDRSGVLGEIVNDDIHLSPTGQTAHDFWYRVPEHFPNVTVASFIVMPNHVHAIIIIHEQLWYGAGRGVVSTPIDGNAPPSAGRGVVSTPIDGNAQSEGRETLPLPDLGQIIGFYKYQTTKQINIQLGSPGVRFWQRNYFERVVRNQEELHRFLEYIRSNPQRWLADQLHPSAPPNQINQGTI